MKTKSKLPWALKRAKYIQYGTRIEGIGQCGLMACDYSKILKDDKTGEEYRFCTKLNIQVDSYDSCKYHRQKKAEQALADLASFLKTDQENRKV